MANAKQYNVLFCDTDGTTYTGPLRIETIKYIGNASGTVVIKSGTTAASGDVLWQESGTNNLPADSCEIFAKDGINVTITNGAKVYIYLCSER